MRHLLDLSPGDAFLSRYVEETEAELGAIKRRIHSLKTPAARLQACLTRKAACDKEVLSLAQTAHQAAMALDAANTKLLAATTLQGELEIDLRDLRLDGLLGQPPDPVHPSPINIMAFAKAIIAAIAPQSSLSDSALEQMAGLCGLAPGEPSASAPGGGATPPVERPARGMPADRARSRTPPGAAPAQPGSSRSDGGAGEPIPVLDPTGTSAAAGSGAAAGEGAAVAAPPSPAAQAAAAAVAAAAVTAAAAAVTAAAAASGGGAPPGPRGSRLPGHAA